LIVERGWWDIERFVRHVNILEHHDSIPTEMPNQGTERGGRVRHMQQDQPAHHRIEVVSE